MQITIYTVSLISIKNKCLYDAIRDLKREEKKFGKGGIEPGSIAFKRHTGTRFTIGVIAADVLHRLHRTVSGE